MNFKIKSFAYKLFIPLISFTSLTGCWDLVEVNQLAIVNMLGADKDPKTGKHTTYYQVVNPPGIAKQGGSGIKSPVYSYKIEASSIPETEIKTSQIIPRVLFPDHYQAIIITERYARTGLREMVNFIDRKNNRHSSVNLLITDSPLAEVMNTYIPLERLSGLTLRSMIKIQSEQFGSASEKSRIKDLGEKIESSALTIMPLISLASSKPAPSTDRYEQINANQGNITFTGGAVFEGDRMIGKLKQPQLSLYYLLSGQTHVLSQTLTVNQEKIYIRAIDTVVSKHLSYASGQLSLRFDMKTKLQIQANQNVILTKGNLAKIKESFHRQVEIKTNELYHMGRMKGWDLLGIEEQIKWKRGKEWEQAKKNTSSWKETKIDLTVISKVTDTGVIKDPYKGEQHHGGS